MRVWWAMGLTLVVTACGGGGGGGGGAVFPVAAPAVTTSSGTSMSGSLSGNGASDAPDAVPPEIVNSSTVAGRCAAPRRQGGYFDRSGTLSDEKRWVRSWIDETYLWFDEVPNLKSADYATPVAYFNVLKTPALTPGGQPKDRFHFTLNTADYETLSATGVSVGYGITFAYLRESVPRDVRVAYVEPGSPAEAAGITRGMQLLSVDGVDAVNSSDAAKLNAGLVPGASGELHVFGFRDLSGAQRDFRLSSTQVSQQLVQNANVVQTAGAKVGYLQLNAYQITAEAPLIDTMARFKAQGVTELVLDMRYNGGGLLALASELAYMVAPEAKTRGQVFEKLTFNRKNPFKLTDAQASMGFFSTGTYGDRAGRALPRLGLSRVTVLTGPDTCSASESVVNGLRGVGVQVDLVGGATCGKPYGFLPTDNCGTTYFTIQFRGVNAQGFGDYADGFQPTCEVADDFSQPLGAPEEGRFKAALHWIEHGSCPSVAVASRRTVMKSSGSLSTPQDSGPQGPVLRQSPTQTNRLLMWQDMAR